MDATGSVSFHKCAFAWDTDPIVSESVHFKECGSTSCSPRTCVVTYAYVRTRTHVRAYARTCVRPVPCFLLSVSLLVSPIYSVVSPTGDTCVKTFPSNRASNPQENLVATSVMGMLDCGSDVSATAFLIYGLVAAQLSVVTFQRLRAEWRETGDGNGSSPEGEGLGKGDVDGRQRLLLRLSRVGILILTVGTTLDNFRHFCGSFSSLPVFNAANVIVTWICYIAHEILAALSFFTPFQFLVSHKSSEEIPRKFMLITSGIVTIFSLMGIISFSLKEAPTELQVVSKCTGIGDLKILEFKGSNPLGLINVFAWSFLLIISCFYLNWKHGLRSWCSLFTLANILALLGQMLPAFVPGLGSEYMCYASNFWEQFIFCAVVAADGLLNCTQSGEAMETKVQRKQDGSDGKVPSWKAFFFGIDGSTASSLDATTRCCDPWFCVPNRWLVMFLAIFLFCGFGGTFTPGILRLVTLAFGNSQVTCVNDHIIRYVALAFFIVGVYVKVRTRVFELVRAETERIRRLRRPFVLYFAPPIKLILLVLLIVVTSLIDKALEKYYWDDIIMGTITAIVCFSLLIGALVASWEWWQWESPPPQDADGLEKQSNYSELTSGSVNSLRYVA